MIDEMLEFTIQTDETPETMAMTFGELMRLIRAEHNDRLEQLLADFEALVAKRLPGQAVQLQSAFDISKLDSPLRLYVIIALHAGTAPPLTPSPTRELPPMPSFTVTRRMAARMYENALLFWWPTPEPGMIFILWRDSGEWESTPDASPANQAGFDWLASGVELGPAQDSEAHGDGCLLTVAEGTWLKTPDEFGGAIYFLWPDGMWQTGEQS